MTSKSDSKFLSEEIEMLESAHAGEPIKFRWRDQEHQVVQTIKSWQDWGHPSGAHKKSWKTRKHRNYFEVKTDLGLHGLIYFDRGVKPSSPRKWIILECYN
jgi:hypothetical protein